MNIQCITYSGIKTNYLLSYFT